MIVQMVPTADRIADLASCIASDARKLQKRQRRLTNLAEVYRDDIRLNRSQVQEGLRLLLEMRGRVRDAYGFLNGLDLEDVKLLHPYESMCKLKDLESLVSETILYCAAFEEVCEVPRAERIRLHMEIRTIFPRVLIAYQSTHEHLATLAKRSVGQEEETSR